VHIVRLEGSIIGTMSLCGIGSCSRHALETAIYRAQDATKDHTVSPIHCMGVIYMYTMYSQPFDHMTRVTSLQSCVLCLHKTSEITRHQYTHSIHTDARGDPQGLTDAGWPKRKHQGPNFQNFPKTFSKDMSDDLGVPKKFSYPNFRRLSLRFQKTSSFLIFIN